LLAEAGHSGAVAIEPTAALIADQLLVGQTRTRKDRAVTTLEQRDFVIVFAVRIVESREIGRIGDRSDDAAEIAVIVEDWAAHGEEGLVVDAIHRYAIEVESDAEPFLLFGEIRA